MNKVFREEKKYLLSIEEFLKFSNMLQKVMIQDDHNGTHGYFIRSLYFDTVYDKDYFEKAAGVELRRKIRLRTYDVKNDFAMLEIKQKQGVQQLKRSLRLTRKDAVCLSKGDYSPLLNYPEPFAAECYAILKTQVYRPVTVVQYNRKAFIAKENKIRITFDNQIVASESCMDLFAENLDLNPVLDPFLVVLEVKYNGFLLDYHKKLLETVDKSELSVSKYVLARQNGYQTSL